MYSSEWKLFILGFGKKTLNGGACHCGSAARRARWLLSVQQRPPACPSLQHSHFHMHMKTNSTEGSRFSPAGEAAPRCQQEQDMPPGPSRAGRALGTGCPAASTAHRSRECTARGARNRALTGQDHLYPKTWPLLRILILWDLLSPLKRAQW